MSRFVVLCALLAAALAVGSAPPPPAAPAADFYLKIKGIDGEAEDGAIALAGLAWDTDADVGQFAAEPPQEVLARYGGAQFSSGGMSGVRESSPRPREAASGMETGRRQHSWPMKIVKQYDRATPKLLQACADGTHLDVEVWERNASGQEQLRYTLKEAIITSISLDRGADGTSPPIESISFTFDKIEMTPAAAETRAVNLNSSKSN